MANDNDRNQHQIFRQDARNCFVEICSDAFPIGKVHLGFAKYDATKPKKQRQTGYISSYIDIPDFLALAHEVLSGAMHMKMQQHKEGKNKKPLYQSLGGTSAERLAEYSRSRSDGMSESRTIKLSAGDKIDYLFCAESGSGKTDEKGLIVPQYGTNPEQRVSVSMGWRDLNKLMLVTKANYEAWLTAQYLRTE